MSGLIARCRSCRGSPQLPLLEFGLGDDVAVHLDENRSMISRVHRGGERRQENRRRDQLTSYKPPKLLESIS